MSKLSGSRLGLAIVALLAGTALSGARAAPPTDAQIAAFCNEPKGMEIYPAPAEAERPVEPGLPPKAKRAHKSGCAGIKFHIGKDGLVHDATVVVEHPEGFGFAKATLAALAETNYGAKQAADHWYFINSVFSIQDLGSSANPDVE